MHAPGQRPGTSRRRVVRRRRRYSICGLARIPARSSARPSFWTFGILYVALATSALGLIRYSPVTSVDPARGALVAPFTFEDFANASR